MGSGQRGDTASKLANRQDLLTGSGSPIIDCDIRARVGADAVVPEVEAADGWLMRAGSDVLFIVDGTHVATLHTADVTEKIVACLSRGQRFVGRVSTVEGRVVVDVRPTLSA